MSACLTRGEAVERCCWQLTQWNKTRDEDDVLWRQMSLFSNPKQKFHLSHLLVDFTRLFCSLKKE